MSEPGSNGRTPHTRVPNIVFDFVQPVLSGSAQVCYGYIIRHTYGWVGDNAGERKARDTISLEQFQNGIVAGEFVLDLGTQLSRNAVRKGLAELEAKQLVVVRWACTRCLWEQGAAEGPPPRAEGSAPDAAPQCPRCKRTLSRSWGPAQLTPNKVVGLLNAHAEEKNLPHRYEWDADEKRFRRHDVGRKPAADMQEEVDRLRDAMWYPDLVESAVKMAEGHLRQGRKMSAKRKVEGFYKPVFELQEQYPIAPLIKYGLLETLKGPVLRQSGNSRAFISYLKTVLRNNERRFRGEHGPQSGTNAAQAKASSIDAHKHAVTEMLQRAAELNGRGRAPEARAMLSDVLAQTERIAPLFGNDTDRADVQLRLAFKYGTSDFVGVVAQPFAALDFYPDWSPPDAAA